MEDWINFVFVLNMEIKNNNCFVLNKLKKLGIYCKIVVFFCVIRVVLVLMCEF